MLSLQGAIQKCPPIKNIFPPEVYVKHIYTLLPLQGQ